MDQSQGQRGTDKDYLVLNRPFAGLYEEMAEALAKYPGIEVVVDRRMASRARVPADLSAISRPEAEDAPPGSEAASVAG